MPRGLGEPVFDKLEAELAKAMLSLPATKGFEIGSGFAGTRMKGSEHNDPFEMSGERSAHGDKPFRRRAGRNQQRRKSYLPRRLQTDGHDCAANKKP